MINNPDVVSKVQISVTDHKGDPVEIINSKTLIPGDMAFGQDSVTVLSAITRADGATQPIEDSTAGDLTVPAGGTATLLFPSSPIPPDGSGVYNNTKRLSSSLPVVAYQFNPYCCNFSYTNDATILLPTNALGTQYTVALPPDWSASDGTSTVILKGGLSLLADRDTQLQITIPSGNRIDLTSSTSLAELSPPFSESGPTNWAVSLLAGQVLHLQSNSTATESHDLSGIMVKGDRPFSAFSSHDCTNIPHGIAACDHIEAQLIPDITWGRTFLLPTLARRSNAFSEVLYWQIIAQSEDTTISFDPPIDFTTTLSSFAANTNDCHNLLVNEGDVWRLKLSEREHCIIGSRIPVLVTATAPVSVIGYIVGEQAANTSCAGSPYCSSGDPSMFLVPPAEQLRKNYTFLAPATYAYDFATVVIPSQAASSLTLDGFPLDLRRDDVLVEPMAAGYLVAHIPISDGAHTLEASASFELIVYAYDRFVSYAFAGGLNLTKRPNN